MTDEYYPGMQIVNLRVEPVHCSACGRNMFGGGFNHGLTIRCTPEAADIYPEIAGKEFNICLVCLLKSLGVEL